MELLGWQWGIEPEGGTPQYFRTPAEAMAAALDIAGPVVLFTQNNDDPDIATRIQVGHRTAEGEWIEDAEPSGE